MTDSKRKSSIKLDPEDVKPGTVTSATDDENICLNATYKSYDDFETKYNVWKAKHLHPFRVASSEALRTADGSVSSQFRYRYVVFHCVRYGVPRVRGEGKRPNQNYLPCDCKAMIRLNFNFSEQCLRITSIETRHSNHMLEKNLYGKMVEKEVKRRKLSMFHSQGCQPSTFTNSIKQERAPSEESAESEHTESQSQSPVRFDTYDAAQSFESKPQLVAGQFFQQQFNQLQQQPIVAGQTYQQIWQTIGQVAPTTYATTAPYNISNTWNHAPFSGSLPTNSISTGTASQISPISSTADENDVPRGRLGTVSRPIPLRPSENRAFTDMLKSTSSIPKTEIDAILRSTSLMLHDANLPNDVLENRIKQLNNLISQWSQ
ncbi:Protein CBG24193 [Caenorhabditis briggsae]|uniref:Protein CBG24193 n=2 Tax=Caenorhabditis briggsae TaxID=6238 RepID=A8WK65_CAEBR|nr:Protein CBG24193 [Caenorhabditis briggsae]ULT98318.1 hypothetical protein L3Y34_000009 [Caenorhabditis briggsae]CAP20858.2 Protein CBG24193 [Caenorhabditis briggsae]